MKSSEPKIKISKRDAILDAMLEVVVEQGFHEAPMSLISERSGASAGVIYHHFSSKQEIIEALYQRIRALKRDSFLAGYSPEMEAREAFIQLWMNLYNFYRKHLREMRFLEQYESAGFACAPHEASMDREEAHIFRRFQGRSQGGVLKDWPLEVLQELTIGLVERLARRPRKLTQAVLRDVGATVWEAVRAND